MSLLRVSLLSFVFSFLYFTVNSQTFPCDGRLMLSAVSSNTTVYSISFGGFGAVFYSGFPVYIGESFDAVGFNPKDNYIYGFQASTQSIVRLRSNGSYEVLGTVPQLNAYAGDCSPEGLYLCHSNELDKILVYEVMDNFQLVNQLDLFWDPESENSGPFTTRLDDFAIDPNDPTVAYAFQGNYLQNDFLPAATRGYLLRINLDFTDPNVGMVTPVVAIPINVVRQLGSLFFTQNGQLFGLGPFTTGPFIENRLISINPTTGATYTHGLSPPQAAISDGCSCPYSLSFENDIITRFTPCSNAELSFVLKINNRSNEALTDLVLTDTIPEGIIIQGVTGDFSGTIAPGTGVGTNMISINNLNVAPKEQVVITINAAVVDIPVGYIDNQAHLFNLPSLFGGYMASDDPQTVGFIGDASQFASNPQPIDQVEVEVIPPSNCLDANDAQMIVSSPLLLAGENYQIKLRNQSWEEFNFQLDIDNDQTFVLDSLRPGEYHIAQVTPQNSRCSFAWKDTTIIIDPPNEQLQVTATSNSPLCAGLPLQLNATVDPDGSVTWRGPEIFFSTQEQTQINPVTPAYTGTFEMTARYGACEQVRTIEVEVAEEIQASIMGELEYCEREDMVLSAEGNGTLETFRWSGPAELQSSDSLISIPTIRPDQAGQYEVFIDNGYCIDTASVWVTVLPSPSIVLPRVIETDFCETVSLSSEITGDNAVSYSWTPNEGLSCYDCPAPTLQVPFLSRYQLTVINDYRCTDTALVSPVLAREKLMYVPNVFSPNRDGINDYFQLFPDCGVAALKNLAIVDRWGAVVYAKSTIDPQDTSDFWNGMINGKVAPAGVYIWQVEVALVDGSQLKLFGDVTVLR